MGSKGVIMKDEDAQVIDLTRNYESLENENKDKLLIIGKKLLDIKSLVWHGKARKKQEKFENNL
jgi:hypothetical protein